VESDPVKIVSLEMDGGQTPLKLMHLRPTSRMRAAAWIEAFLSDEDTRRCSSVRDSGEFIVIVAAVCSNFIRTVHYELVVAGVAYR
jgi:hypothetical protein